MRADRSAGPARSHRARVGPLGNACQGLVQLTVGIDAVPPAVKPNVVEPWAARDPFQDRFFTVAVVPVTVSVPLQSWMMDCPLASVHLTVQAVMAELPAVTVTWPWKPPDHELAFPYVAVQAPPCAGGELTGGVLGGTLTGGLLGGLLDGRVLDGVVGGVLGGYGALLARL